MKAFIQNQQANYRVAVFGNSRVTLVPGINVRGLFRRVVMARWPKPSPIPPCWPALGRRWRDAAVSRQLFPVVRPQARLTIPGGLL